MTADDNKLPRMLRGKLTYDDWIGMLAVTDVDVAFAMNDPVRYEGKEGQDRLEYETLHSRAILFLQNAERHLCPIRVEVLLKVSEQLDPNALPQDFFRRLVLVQGCLASAGRKRRRTTERDEWVRIIWHLHKTETGYRLRRRSGWKPATYTDVLQHIADVFLLSPKSIEAALAKPLLGSPTSELRESEFTRVKAAADERFPKKSGLTSR